VSGPDHKDATTWLRERVKDLERKLARSMRHNAVQLDILQKRRKQVRALERALVAVVKEDGT
jgi:hypothetical protein